MNFKSKLIPFALTSVMAATPLFTFVPASADETTSQENTATEQTTNQSIIKTVNEAFNGMREIHAARLAIFNGDIDSATKFTSEAQTNFNMAEKAVGEYQIKTNKSTNSADAFIPFDMKIELSEGFVPTEDKHEHLVKANEYLKSGDQQKAIEVLRLANIEVTVSAAMLPAKSSMKHVKDAVDLLKNSKFYEANLALKAVEDSVILDFYSIDAIPAQGSQS